MGVQRVQQRAQHEALRGSGIKGKGGGGGDVWVPTHLLSAGLEAVDPSTQVEVQSKVTQLSNQPGGDYGIEC